MADKRITDLPLILSGDITSTDVLPIVDVNLDITNKIEVDQLKSYILSGVNDFYVTGGTYSGGTLTLDRQNGSILITGFTTGSTVVSLYEEITYDELYSKYTGETLTPGKHYLITDFQTCYDQPDFDYNGNPITTPETYHVSDIDPILVFATSSSSLSPNAYQPAYPKDKITYDITFTQTEATSSPAKGRITERIDEFNNRTDYDHRTILFKRYKSYFQDGSISGRIIEMNNGIVTGLNTNFDTQLTTGSTIWILSQNPQLYEVISIDSPTSMTVVGFNYQNFSDPVGFECEIMLPSNLEPLSGSLYYFNDVGSNAISDGGNDMYDGGNEIYTDLFSNIPYTHTQMQNPPINEGNQAAFGDFTYDGTVQNGDLYFNTGSNYFTNQYPGLFVMSAYDVNITDFEIDGNLGSDGGGQADTYDYTLNYGGNDYSVYCKRVWDAQDPSVNHIYIVNTIDGNITHNIDFSTQDDLDTISNLTGVTQIHYLLFALANGVKPTNVQIQNVVNSYLSLIDQTDINVTLSNLNLNFTGITSNLPENNSAYKSLNYKQTNLTGDTIEFAEYLTFGTLSSDQLNNYIGNYANTFEWDNNTFILSNNVFYGNLAYVNNTFGNSCFNNTFDDDCTNNIIGNFFFNNTTDDDFDDNLIGNGFSNNYITSNFQKNRIGDNFNNNTIITGSFYRNDIGNQFESNTITNGDFQNNEIGNGYNNNIIYDSFYKNDVGNGFNNNKFYRESFGNLISNGFNNNRIYASFSDNQIGENFNNWTIGDSNNIFNYNFSFNKIGNDSSGNNAITNFNNNVILNNFNNNTLNGDFFENQIGNSFYSNNCLGLFGYNTIGNYFNSNTIGDGFGFGFSTSQGNTIGNYFYSNTIGEYFYNNVIVDGFYSNTVVDFFQLNDIKCSVFSTDFTLSTYVYGDYNCTIFKNAGLTTRLSYYDASDVLTITDINL